MTLFYKIVNKNYKINLLLFLCSFLYYFIYLKHIFLNANNVLSTLNGDSFKNYYVFIHHIINDPDLINFPSFNYPFGEHIVYTDAQPLLTFIFRLLPFTHNYLIGLMHLLILFSFVITPCIYFKIFKLFKVNSIVAFFSSLAVVILSPQLMRIGGHFGLCYACFIPLLIYFLIKYSLHPTKKIYVTVLILNFLLFFIHPYFGMGLCLLTLIYVFLFELINKTNWLRFFLATILMGILPIILFKLVMLITDTHSDRPEWAYGADVYVSNPASVFVSYFGGPFEHFMKQIIKVGNREWEGVSYVGFFVNFLIVLIAILSIVFFKKYKFNKIVVILFLSSIILLLFSFGLHTMILKSLNIEIAALSQFRSAGRFAWFFYYIVPIFLIVSLNKFFTDLFNKNALKWMIPLAFLFLTFNIIEGHYFFRMIFSNTFDVKNVFNYNYLNKNEKKLVAEVNSLNAQAILPVPFYHKGSETIDRNGTESYYISMLLSYHCNLPIISAFLARTSVTETVEEIGLLNEYINHDKILSKFNNKSIALVLSPQITETPDETRLVMRANFINHYGDYKLYNFNKKEFAFNEGEIDSSYVNLILTKNVVDTLGIKFIKTENRKPFITSNEKDYEVLFKIDKGQYPSGKYVVSFHYHYKELKFKYIDCNLIVEKTEGIEKKWESYSTLRRSIVLNNFLFFEIFVNINSNFQYSFILNGGSKKDYFVSDFLFRPEEKNIKIILKPDSVLINNFPYNK